LTEFRRPQPFDRTRHDRSEFDSGEPTLDDWLRRYAGQNRRSNTAATWVIVDEHDVVAAYASLSMTGIDRASAGPFGRGAPEPVPALLIGRLAVDRRHAGLGLGTALVAQLLGTAAELNEKAACRAVVVTAVNEGAREWWESFGFVPLEPDDPESLDLYLLTSDIEATLKHMR
jgi:GNAT superfamily N-acetyltransferase